MAITGTVPAKFTSNGPGGGERFEVPPGSYYVQLIEVDEAERRPNQPEDWGNSWKWLFRVSDTDGNFIMGKTLGEDGLPQPLPMVQFTSDRMGISPAGVRARGRRWLEALLRRDLREREDLGQAVAEATGKIAQALISVEQNRQGVSYCKIAQLSKVPDEVAEKFERKRQQSKAATTASDEVPF